MRLLFAVLLRFSRIHSIKKKNPIDNMTIEEMPPKNIQNIVEKGRVKSFELLDSGLNLNAGKTVK